VSPLTPPAPADRFARLIEGLCQAIAARGAASGLAVPLMVLIWSRLRRMAARFARLADRVRAGTLPRRAARRSGKSGPPPPRLPGNFAWLVRLVPQAAAGGSQLRHLLADPEMAELLAAAPQMGRILRPLCRMLGVRPPPGPLAPPPRPRAPPSQPAGPSPDLTQGCAPPPAPLPPRPPVPRHLAPPWCRRAKVFGSLPPFPA
jgi:hypothetical protein